MSTYTGLLWTGFCEWASHLLNEHLKNRSGPKTSVLNNDGHGDTNKQRLFINTFIKPYSLERLFAHLLVTALSFDLLFF